MSCCGIVSVNVELKTLPIRYDGIEEALVALLRKTDYPLDNLIVSSFDHVSLLRLQSLEPRIAIAALFSHYPTSLASLPGTILHPHWGVVDSKLVAKARLAGRAVNVWTANEPRVWSHLVACGVNGIVTDHPDQLQEWLDGSIGYDLQSPVHSLPRPSDPQRSITGVFTCVAGNRPFRLHFPRQTRII